MKLEIEKLLFGFYLCIAISNFQFLCFWLIGLPFLLMTMQI